MFGTSWLHNNKNLYNEVLRVSLQVDIFNRTGTKKKSQANKKKEYSKINTSMHECSTITRSNQSI